MRTAVGDHATAPSAPKQFSTVSRILHWVAAILVFSALFLGFVMVNSLSDYATLRRIHQSIGAVLLAVVLVRLINRITHRAPALPTTVGRVEKLMVFGSEAMMYALLVAQPLVGWAMVSASGTPVVVFGSLRLPAIAPVNLGLFSALRETHSVLAYLLVAVIAAHISAVLLHSIALRDGMLARMTCRPARSPRPPGGGPGDDQPAPRLRYG